MIGKILIHNKIHVKIHYNYCTYKRKVDYNGRTMLKVSNQAIM